MKQPLARIWYAATLLAVVAGLVIETVLAADASRSGSSLARVANLMTYFTIQSNLLVGIVAGVIASGHTREATWFRALFVAALLGISITAIVFHAVLAAPAGALSGAAAVGDALVHIAAPALFLVGWIVFGPRGVLTLRALLLSLLYPLGWLTFTLVRGAIAGYYPYPFMDVGELGYARTAANLAIIVALALVLALAFAGIDRAFRRSTQRP